MSSSSPSTADGVEILGLRFPRMKQEQVVAELLTRLLQGTTTAVAFPDMSTMNLVVERPGLRRLLQRRFLIFNDGAGLAWAARRRGQPFPDNLNGTDLCPALFAAAPPETRVFLVGGPPGVAERAQAVLAGRFPHLRFCGHHHGYLDARGDAEALAALRAARPQIILVGMGNPLQVEWIERHRDDPALAGALWLAVGGQLEYYGGDLRRAPAWMRRARLEWLHIVRRQPHKARRYFVGIPTFLLRCLAADLGAGHGVEPQR